ncbi:hypothetical protein JOB18_032498 [Solea senegalensis]|uniref:Arginine vasopressin-induced protein 1/transcriptional and immune response regulator domain-containing protein n=2 Tax=Solea senegalensis TaxID=28829 RepID=A0AAV6PAD0_SOLSE|nr:hypothetical protein JOB18_032498 [Solea senegalensis]
MGGLDMEVNVPPGSVAALISTLTVSVCKSTAQSFVTVALSHCVCSCRVIVTQRKTGFLPDSPNPFSCLHPLTCPTLVSNSRHMPYYCFLIVMETCVCPLHAEQIRYKYARTQLSCAHSLSSSSLRGLRAHLTAHPQRVGETLSAETHKDIHPSSYRRKQKDDMSTYASSECRRVSPSVHGNKFDTAHRKKAVANIFENVNQDSLMKLFQKTGDMKAEERVRSIYSYTQDPEETSRALMALKQRKKDKFLQIAGMVRQLLNLR